MTKNKARLAAIKDKVLITRSWFKCLALLLVARGEDVVTERLLGQLGESIGSLEDEVGIIRGKDFSSNSERKEKV